MRVYVHYDKDRHHWKAYVNGYGRGAKRIYVGSYNARFIAVKRAEEKLEQIKMFDPDKWLMHQRWVQAA